MMKRVLRAIQGVAVVLFVSSAISVALFFEQVSPAYWLAEAMWFEARGESRSGRMHVAAVIMNRADDARWPSSIEGVVRYREHVAPVCDFSYRCDGKPNNMFQDRAQWEHVLTVRAEAWAAWTLRSIFGRWFDPSAQTFGAVYYKRADAASRWFDRQISSGRMFPIRHEGAHVFYAAPHP